MNCKKPESFICSNINCNIKVCRKCYKTFPINSTTTIIPTNINGNEEVEYMNELNESDNDSNSEESDDDNVSINTENSNKDEDLEDLMNKLVVYSEQDLTLDTTEDNINERVGFMTKNSGDIPMNVNQSLSRDTCSGHVLFNRVGSYTLRPRNNIEGTSRPKHMVQSLCAQFLGKHLRYYNQKLCYFLDIFIYLQTMINCLYLVLVRYGH